MCAAGSGIGVFKGALRRLNRHYLARAAVFWFDTRPNLRAARWKTASGASP